jgi:hypothetical protein
MASKINKYTLNKAITICIAFVYLVFSCAYVINCKKTTGSFYPTSVFYKTFQNKDSKKLPEFNSSKNQNSSKFKFLSRPRVIFSNKDIVFVAAIIFLSILALCSFDQKTYLTQHYYGLKRLNPTSLIIFLHIWRI